MGGHGSGFTKEKRLVNEQLGKNRSQGALPAGDSFIIPNLSGDHSAGTTGTPVNDRDIANKKYVDDNAGGTGTMTTVKEEGTQLGGADIITLDFLGADFDLTESPDKEINIVIADAGIDHDATTNFVAAEHVDWALVSQGTIHITNFAALQNIVEDTTPELGGEMDAGAHTIGFTQQSAIGDGATTIDWKLGNKFFFTFGAFNETFTFTAPSNPCNILLVLKQDGTGSRTATWPAAVKWPGGTAPTLTATASAIDIIAFYFDGTNYYGVESLAFS